MRLDGAITLWFALVVIFTTYVAIDIRTTPEAKVMKSGFVILTAFSGPFGALLYVLSCKEPLPGTHEQFIAPRWKQVVGSTAHCVAGDGIGIFIAAGVTGLMKLSFAPSLVIEYAVGFLFGWTIFQSLFMKSSSGGSYMASLRSTFLPEFLSMNGVMAGMIAVMVPWMSRDPIATNPLGIRFWFVMSVALCAGFIVAYPINWWLVSQGLKHGMMTVRPEGYVAPNEAMASHGAGGHSAHSEHISPAAAHGGDHSTMDHDRSPKVSRGQLVLATVITLGILSTGIAIAATLGNLSSRLGTLIAP